MKFSQLVKLLLVGSVVAGSFALAACQAPKTASSSQAQQVQKSDSEVETAVNQAIDSVIPSKSFPHRVRAVVWEGKTLLIGQAQTEELTARITDLVHQVYGVKEIYNRIVVKPDFNPQTLDAARDTRITAELRTRILATRGITSADFSITTQDGIVYILSKAEAQQTQVAVAIAQQILGVVSVQVLRP